MAEIYDQELLCAAKGKYSTRIFNIASYWVFITHHLTEEAAMAYAKRQYSFMNTPERKRLIRYGVFLGNQKLWDSAEVPARSYSDMDGNKDEH